MSTHSPLAVAGIGVLVIVATALSSRAQVPTYGLGRAAHTARPWPGSRR